MRTFLKWFGIILGVILGILLIAVAGVLIYSTIQFKPTDQNRPLYPITADTSPEGIARGEYLLNAVTSCTEACHSGDGGPYAGYVEELNEGPISAVFAVPNLTSDQATGIGSWTDAEIARAIREGYDKDGVKLMVMPSPQYSVISDADIAAVVGYLRSLDPVQNEVPPLELNLAGKVLMAFGMIGPVANIPPVSEPINAPPTGTAEYGGYLVSLGTCRDCHGVNLSGNTSEFTPPGPNLTPGGPLATWSEADFLNFMRTGTTPGGSRISDEMPWRAYGQMTDEDLKAMYLYLKGLPALEFGQ